MADGTGAYEGFEGQVGRVFATSEPWWPPRPTPPPGAPNIVVVLVDDLGYADLGCYGSEIATPNIDALAASGLRYTNYHATPMCSPTRASLLSGMEPHLAGVGTVAHSDPGFPGYAMELADDVATLPETLRAAGYATYMVGKWHLSKDSGQSDAGPRSSWPCQKGFDRFYGVLDAFTNLHHPHRLVCDNTPVEVDAYPEGYYFTDDITDEAIAMIKAGKAADPTKPFFAYVAHGAVHAPLHAPADAIAEQRGRYDLGWDALREERYRRQLELGIVPEGVELAPRNRETGNEVQPWDSLSDDERELFARHMEVYAAMVESVDASTGRILAALEEIGELDNTLVVFTSDNGASREGELVGTSSYMVHLLNGDDVAADRARLDLLGGPQTSPHYPRGWAMAGNTPFRLYKINTHAGGHTVPFVVSWPRRLTEGGGTLRRQYAHVSDLMPTFLELTGVTPLTERDGRPAKPITGCSMAPTLFDPEAPAQRTEAVYEMIGHRGYYRDGWEVVTLHQPWTPFDDSEWELYHLADDPTELRNLAAEQPEKTAELARAWEAAAWATQIFPLDEGTGLKYVLRPPHTDVVRAPLTIWPGTPTLERWRSLQLVWMCSVDITARLHVTEGDHGTLVAHGDQSGGYALYVLEGGLPALRHNDGRGTMTQVTGPAVGPGDHEVTAHLSAIGNGQWRITIEVDGVAGPESAEVPLLYGMAPFEGISVGRDPRSPVCWDLFREHGSYPYSGQLRSVTYTPGDGPPDQPDDVVDLLRKLGAKYD
ncbi:arylsulfatase [Rhabdothermincola salaria]|uniref:arylsulfatase n=1 Tax=Rhabdothermincola salaria TaxID=2903142 RepID=UPI001E35C8F9|nr:arylsulfatase [Rhabdothermincola salaria]MCD9623299.1 arylsulfatase [Rhabdothermincola salaria]